SSLRGAQAHRRAGIRHDQVRARNPQVSVARPGESVGRVATDLLDSQSFEDLAPLLQRRGKLRGIVRAQGWAEAEKAKAQRNPAAMREHEQIFGQAPRQTENSTLIDGVPTLVVEILSPRETIEDINEKINAYLAARVYIIWIIDPYRRTITVHQPDSVPKLFNVRDELSVEPHLPGFRVPVARLFE